jgi:hypothetical protein
MHETERIENNWELIYHYRKVSRYYEPVKAFLENFSEVKIILNEDLEGNPSKTLSEIFDFLGVDNTIELKDTSTRYNLSGKPRSRWLHNFLHAGHPIINWMIPVLKYIIPKDTRDTMTRKVKTINLKRTTINKNTGNMLLNEFREEIIKLQELTNLDLSRWLRKFE